MTYKPDVADLRGAAPVALLHALRGAGAQALWHDPLVADPPPELADIPRIADPAVAAADALVLGTPHSVFDLVALAAAAPLVFDPFGLLPPDLSGRVRAV